MPKVFKNLNLLIRSYNRQPPSDVISSCNQLLCSSMQPMKLAIPDLVGPVAVSPQPDGPLKVEGAIEVATGTGRAVARVRKAFLCRCGQSANKPFCDGSHKRVGFTAP